MGDSRNAVNVQAIIPSMKRIMNRHVDIMDHKLVIYRASPDDNWRSHHGLVGAKLWARIGTSQSSVP